MLSKSERDAFTATTPQEIAYGEGACVETPPKLFELLHQRFKFDVDLTANETNHLLPVWFGPGSPYTIDGVRVEDSLTADWSRAGTLRGVSGFSNPPYGPFIPKILRKAIEERAKGFTSVFLLPMRAAGWFRDLVLPQYSELWYCSERIVFHYQGKPKLSANVKWTPTHGRSPLLTRSATGAAIVIHPTQLYQTNWVDTWGTAWPYEFGVGQAVKQPAGALFDSIIVVYAPYDRAKWGLFPPPQRPNIFEVKTGELRF